MLFSYTIYKLYKLFTDLYFSKPILYYTITFSVYTVRSSPPNAIYHSILVSVHGDRPEGCLCVRASACVCVCGPCILYCCNIYLYCLSKHVPEPIKLYLVSYKRFSITLSDMYCNVTTSIIHTYTNTLPVSYTHLDVYKRQQFWQNKKSSH